MRVECNMRDGEYFYVEVDRKILSPDAPIPPPILRIRTHGRYVYFYRHMLSTTYYETELIKVRRGRRKDR